MSYPNKKHYHQKTTARKKNLSLTLKIIFVSLAYVGIGSLLLARITPDQSEQRSVNETVTQAPSSGQLPTHYDDSQAESSETPLTSPSTLYEFQEESHADKRDLPINGLAYNNYPPSLGYSDDLQTIVEEILDLVAERGLPLDSISITLIDLTNNTKAGHQEQQLRFPASISKLFWMVEVFAWVEQGMLPSSYTEFDLMQCSDDICRMIQDSDNEAASRIVDALSATHSSHSLPEQEMRQWLSKRMQLNDFFTQAGYININITQKNFPIPYLNLYAPSGTDLDMRGDPSAPLRNQISTEQAARLMYEIFMEKSVSSEASIKMRDLLTRADLQTGEWRDKEYNAIEGFFGEGLSPRTEFASKVGWTSDSRQEVAFIEDPSGGAVYILAIFAEGQEYGDDWTIFPDISRLVFTKMTHLGFQQ